MPKPVQVKLLGGPLHGQLVQWPDPELREYRFSYGEMTPYWTHGLYYLQSDGKTARLQENLVVGKKLTVVTG